MPEEDYVPIPGSNRPAAPGSRWDREGEMVSVAAEFDGFTGRWMYHCHILEHEDNDKMRPFVVLPKEALDVMDAMKDMPMLDGMDMGEMR